MAKGLTLLISTQTLTLTLTLIPNLNSNPNPTAAKGPTLVSLTQTLTLTRTLPLLQAAKGSREQMAAVEELAASRGALLAEGAVAEADSNPHRTLTPTLTLTLPLIPSR